jgi:anti-sigma regulatory factor (Ser/Thr protein kinase)
MAATAIAPVTAQAGRQATTATTSTAQKDGGIASPSCRCALPHQPEAAGTARRIARTTLTAWGVEEDTVDQAVLVVSELVTNAVEHALPPVALHLALPAGDASVHIEVDDGGSAEEEGAWTASCSDDEHGRGSGIIDCLAIAHGACINAHGATYWAELPAAA